MSNEIEVEGLLRFAMNQQRTVRVGLVGYPDREFVTGIPKVYDFHGSTMVRFDDGMDVYSVSRQSLLLGGPGIGVATGPAPRYVATAEFVGDAPVLQDRLTALLDDFLANQRPSDEYDEVAMTFTLTRRQVEKVREWMETVEAKVPSRPTAIGGRYTYAFTPNSIGVVCVVQDSDSGTGETLDVSDYEDW